MTALDQAEFRTVMGRFATGVTVITAEADGGVRGMTANAFMSGSLAPPLRIISVAKKAKLHKKVVKLKKAIKKDKKNVKAGK